MVQLSPNDVELDALLGQSVLSPTHPGTSFAFQKKLAAGGMSVAFLCMRRAPEGECAVVVKVMLPSLVRANPGLAMLVLQKEAVALGRLNDRVPSTPFVVRLIDAGVFDAVVGTAKLELPWLAIEYVHGGVEGTTLTERVKRSMRLTLSAFDPDRAIRAIESLAEGISAVHGVGVIHRDLKPDNVLACGSGDDEILKIVDFGVARPAGLAQSFGGLVVGTPGYAAPEQIGGDDKTIGPATDVFAFAAIAFYLLAGVEYFPGDNPLVILRQIVMGERRALLDAEGIHPDLRAHPESCLALDTIFARATSVEKEGRPPTAQDFASTTLTWLRTAARRAVSVRGGSRSYAFQEEPSDGGRTLRGARVWTRRHRGGELVVRRVAWNSDGTCLAVTASGLQFWDGTTWRRAHTRGLENPDGVVALQALGPGRWLLGGASMMLAEYTQEGVSDLSIREGEIACIEHASGSVEDLGVLVVTAPGRSPLLYCIVGKRWLRPFLLEGVATISSLDRIGEETWLIAGRSVSGRSYAAIYEPLQWSVQVISQNETYAFLGCAGHPGKRAGVVAGTEGCVLFLDKDGVTSDPVSNGVSLSAVSIDARGHAWAASLGTIWQRAPRDVGGWLKAWEDPSMTAPIISLHADVGLLLATTADGAVVEGRFEEG